MLNFMIFLLLLFTGYIAEATVSIGISGATSKSNFSLEARKSTVISGSVAVSIYSFLRVGFTHRRSFENKSGTKRLRAAEPDTFAYEPFTDNTEIITNSVDLTAVLYQGQLSPFVFGGIARRDYFTESEIQNTRYKSRTTLPSVPNYGFGVSVLLSRQFNLKITQTYTPGSRTEIVDGEEKDSTVIDNYAQIGVSYKI